MRNPVNLMIGFLALLVGLAILAFVLVKELEKELAASQAQIGSLEAEARKQIAAARAVALVEDQSAA